MTEVSERMLDGAGEGLVAGGRSGADLEVRSCFEAYERALVAGDVEAMNGWFADTEQTVRFGVAEEQWGAAQISAWRRATPAVPPGRRLSEVDVTIWAPGVAIATTLFSYPGSTAVGRQSQTWLHTPAGWRIVHAHVSERPAAGGSA